MTHVVPMLVALLTLQAGSDQGVPPNNSSAELDQAVDTAFPEFEHSDPIGEGMKLAGGNNKSTGLAATAPVIKVSDAWQGQDRADMTALVTEAVSLMTDPKLLEYGRTLKPDYPSAWFSQALDYGDAERVAAMVQGPAAPIRYLPATVVPSRRWAQTGGVEGRVRISVNRKLVKRWRSKDVVMRSCAVNTMAHEISHTLSRSATTYLYALTDTGVGAEARRTAPASYLTGNMALCSYLIRQGRIQPSGLKQCMTIWYRPGGFQSKRCDDFPGTTPVE